MLKVIGIINFISFILYGVDKKLAIDHKYRIPEFWLIIITISGGGIGALLGGQFFHHKTLKWYFHVAWIFGTIVDIFIFYQILLTITK